MCGVAEEWRKHAETIQWTVCCFRCDWKRNTIFEHLRTKELSWTHTENIHPRKWYQENQFIYTYLRKIVLLGLLVSVSRSIQCCEILSRRNWNKFCLFYTRGTNAFIDIKITNELRDTSSSTQRQFKGSITHQAVAAYCVAAWDVVAENHKVNVLSSGRVMLLSSQLVLLSPRRLSRQVAKLSTVCKK